MQSQSRRLAQNALADFGTAGTGYAYSFAGSDVTEAKQPGGQDASKTLSSILLNPDGSFRAFGHHARRVYSETGEGLYFTNYKMLLQNVGIGGRGEVMAKAANGQRLPLIDVITKTLSYVKDEVSTASALASALASPLLSSSLHASHARRVPPYLACRRSKSAAARSPTA